MHHRESTVDKDWSDKQIFIHFGVATQHFICGLMEIFGYSEGSKTPAEFDISEIPNGSESIAMKVIRWSDGTYLKIKTFGD